MEVYKQIKKDLFYLYIIILITTFIIGLTEFGTDSTDNGRKRSGIRPHIDNLTGCEYLSAKGGGITPRLDKNGKHICN